MEDQSQTPSLSTMTLLAEDISARLQDRSRREPSPETCARPIPLEAVAPLIEWARRRVRSDPSPSLLAAYDRAATALDLETSSEMLAGRDVDLGRALMLEIEIKTAN